MHWAGRKIRPHCDHWSADDQAVDEAQLSHHGRSQDEGVEVGQTHAVVETVDGVGQWQPCPDQNVEVPLTVGIEVDLHGKRGIGVSFGTDA
jgi:hypothetical protein